MPTYEPDQFLALLSADELVEPSDLSIYGTVKADPDDGSTLLFGISPSCQHWLQIPLSLISSITYARNTRCGDHQHPFVRITLARPQPDNAAAFVFMQLFANAKASAASARLKSVVADQAAAGGDCETFTFDDVPYACCPPASGSGPWDCLIML